MDQQADTLLSLPPLSDSEDMQSEDTIHCNGVDKEVGEDEHPTLGEMPRTVNTFTASVHSVIDQLKELKEKKVLT